MNNILFYGSCQCTNLYLNDPYGRSFLRESLKNFNVTTIYCYTTEISKEDFTEIIKNSDVIVTQPISNNYRNKTYLSLKYILENKKESCKVIVFAPLDFNFYFFDYGHLHVNNQIIELPTGIHFKTLYQYFKYGKSVENFLNECFYNENFKTKEELDLILNDNFIETKKREDRAIELISNCSNCYLIPINEFFMNNHKNYLLHHSHNHPCPVTLTYVSKYILNTIEIDDSKIDYSTDPFVYYPETYGKYQSYPIYSCIKKHLKFDMTQHKICLYGTLNEANRLINMKEDCEIYYSAYKDLKL